MSGYTTNHGVCILEDLLIKIKYVVHINGVQSGKFKFPKTSNPPILFKLGFQDDWLHYVFYMKAYIRHQKTYYAK